ncbi:MAG: aminotransferase class I/II-fold pyridoxal phosphate-dependent enzyme [bacterium]|nr:aminotransferase class I/II-fold pyridoxal phosphate-dependent enzyme [bacterium]
MKIISCSLSPNTEADDVRLAVRVLFSPRTWERGDAVLHVESWFTLRYGVNPVFFNSGRSALLGILRAFDIGEGDEVLTQAFTCIAVPNSIRWAGAKPVYVDIDTSYNLDPRDFIQKITPRTKAVIIQHTFGIPAKLDIICEAAKRHHLIVIEDCAHSLGATYKGKMLGTWGDASFFSFGRDKGVSSVWGGAAMVSPKCKVERAKIRIFQEKLAFPSKFWIAQQLLHPIAFSLILSSYNIYIGKILLVLLQKINMLSLPVYPEEKRGERPNDFPSRFPNALSRLLSLQLSKLDRYNDGRLTVADYYRQKLRGKPGIRLPAHSSESIYMRFPIEVENPARVRRCAQKKGVLLGNWYHSVIDPKGVSRKNAGYESGSCPRAEESAERILNLPTRISLKDAERVVSILLNCV